MDNKNNLLNQILDKVTDIKADTNSLKDRLTEIEKSNAALNQKVEGIDKRLGNLETRINTFEGKLPDISEKFGELKNWRQIAFIILAAFVGWIAKEGIS